MAVHLVRTIVRHALHPVHTGLCLRARVTVFGASGHLQQPHQPLVVRGRHRLQQRRRVGPMLLLLRRLGAHPLRYQTARMEGTREHAATDWLLVAAELMLLQQMTTPMAHAQQLAGVPAGHNGAAPGERAQHIGLVVVTVAAPMEVLVGRRGRRRRRRSGRVPATVVPLERHHGAQHRAPGDHITTSGRRGASAIVWRLIVSAAGRRRGVLLRTVAGPRAPSL